MLPEHDTDDEKPMPVEEEEFIEAEENPQTFVFFDVECTQDDMVQCETGFSLDGCGKCQYCFSAMCGAMEHVPNMCIVHKECTLCMDGELTYTSKCEHCGKKEIIFEGIDTLREFCQWLFSEENYETTVMCHNFQVYDSYPILQYLYKHAIIPSIVPNGANIMCLQVP